MTARYSWISNLKLHIFRPLGMTTARYTILPTDPDLTALSTQGACAIADMLMTARARPVGRYQRQVSALTKK
jgi:hypothetical protein